MPHILVAGKLHPAGIDRLKAAGDVTFKVVEEVSLESYLPHVAGADAVVLRTQPMTAEVIAAAPQLQVVSRQTGQELLACEPRHSSQPLD